MYLFLSRWAGVTAARGDYPFSHHKLTVQFYEASAAQDRKLEGLVHKAILELWRPDPSELTLFLTKGVDSTFLKVPPTSITLTGSSDPCYVEGYHLADSSDGRITLHLKVKASSIYFFLAQFCWVCLWCFQTFKQGICIDNVLVVILFPCEKGAGLTVFIT